ncbi:hypothetical protein [Pseudoalteromonas arctica]|uniref:Uncharacterized protein n=1 Tax=Pseudoalteromonas arctica TaxID=394751 RepID=A0A7Y0DSU9_9GAMM|nr:hypothetical protein [Pseudoalteromonas arctica]NMM41010.1 hypothetical protein [Pseudoalteromonas arctica]
MKKKIVGLFFIPSYDYMGCFFKFNLEFSWFLDENYKLLDLIYSTFSFSIFSIGLWLLASKARVFIMLLFWMMFVFYQTVVWGFSGNRYLSKTEVNSEIDLAVIPYDVGAFSSESFVKLEKFKRKFE